MLTSKFVVLCSLANIVRPVFCTRQVSKNLLRNQSSRGSKIIKGVKNLGKCDGAKNITKPTVGFGHGIFDRYKKLLFWRKPKPQVIEEPTERIHIVEKRAKEITHAIQTDLQSIQRNIEKEVKKTKDIEIERFHQLCKLTECKLKILMKLNTDCGMEKRRVVLMFNDRAHQAFHKLQSDLTPAIEQTSLSLNKLQRDTLTCSKRAINLIETCNKQKNPLLIETCKEMKTDLALTMLEETQKKVCLRIEEIKKQYCRILQTHKITSDDVINAYMKEGALLAEDLQQTIQRVKRRCH